MPKDKIIHNLVSLGFTELAARIYTFLVAESPATGYRIAKAIGKPVANTYKALEMLEQQGAVLTDRSKTRQYRAVPYGDMLDRLERNFMQSRKNAEEALADIKTADWDNNVYQIQSLEQLYDQFRSMLRNAKKIAVIDADPTFYDELMDVVRAEIDRGLVVLIKSYAPLDIPGAKIIPESRDDRFSSRWGVSWMNMVVDASEHLVALISNDGEIYQAVYTRSPVLSYLYHHGINTEIAVDEIMHSLREKYTLDDVERIVSEFYERANDELLNVSSLNQLPPKSG